MKKGKYLISGIILVLVIGFLGILIFKFGSHLYQENRVKNATIIVDLVDDLEVPFASKRSVSDFIEDINGKIIDDFKVDTVSLGEKEIKFSYINDEDIEIPYSFKINVVDNTAPLVWLGSSYSVNTSFNSTLEEKIMCVDDHDDEPNCHVEGEYDTKVPGSYKLNFVAEDSSGNVTNIPFTLKVTKPSSGEGSSYNPPKYKFDDAKVDLGVEGAKFGIDVSSWQGNLDFEKVKNAGVDFAIVRVGSTWGKDGEYFLDSKFERNMEGFNEVGIPVGAYFYSYAKNEDEAREEAEWVIANLKKYDVDLPVAFDFEDWSKFNQYKMSLYRLNRNAEVFIETLEKAGYEGMLYGSLNYLNKIWNYEDKTVWVAHYTKNANYNGKFKFWQFSAAGRVDGVPADVDLDIMYK